MPLQLERVPRGALAGAIGALAWAAVDPLAARVFGTPLTDVRLLGRGVTRGRAWPLAGLAVHVANGAVFGACFAATGGRTVAQGVGLAEVENVALWPVMGIVDRVHPDVRSGDWPRLALSGRAFLKEAAVHAVFGAVTGALVAKED